ncbi:ABC transporter permease [Parafilimonas sp.]|uniref:ABC transporter permease n=1 Tax=Parafilimonas sp. TaxID=1969739 RepID=UPI0039E3BAD5
MFKNYFPARHFVKTAWRNLIKNKLFSIINISGLAIGIAGCMLIGLYVYNELSYDRFHKNADRLFRATTEYTVNGAKNEGGTTGSMAGVRLSAAFPQIESYVRILNFEPYAVQYGQKTFIENKFLFADSTFFSMFSFPLIEGDATTALNAPNKIVITQSTEKKYFGKEDALGKVLRIAGTTDYIVSGIAQDAPVNSQIKFDFVASFASLPNANHPEWWRGIYATYFLLHNSADASALEKGIPAYMKNQKDVGQQGNDYLIYHLEPITKVHLYSSLDALEPNGNIMYIYILCAIAILILGIACVNYTNLSTALAARRISEIGIRKVLGSVRWQLFWQFIGESLLLNLFAVSLAIVLVIASLPQFNQLVERQLSLTMLMHPLSITLLLLFFCIISFTSGAYPAFILSNLKLIKILKTGFSFSGGSGTLRKSLIVFQFFVSVFLIISTVIILQQMSYIRNKNMGYDKDHVIVLPVDGVMRPDFQSIKEAIKRVPDVVSVSCGTEEPTYIHWDDEVTAGDNASSAPLFVHASPTDIDFVKTMNLHLVAGSDYTLTDWMQMSDTTNPHTSFMLNETLAKALGWTPQEAIGKTIYRGDRNGQKGTVKAVVKDFNFAPLHEPIAPLVIFLDSNYRHVYKIFVKVSGNHLPSTLHALENTWKERVTHRPFQYHFLDENFNTIYHTEQQTAQIFSVFAGVAIILACLGLFALTAYTVVQRTKEIGIRKVLGAGAWQIVLLLSFDFIKLVALASLIAFPVAWLFANKWLQSFAYRINISWWVFAIAATVVLTIAFLTISWQAMKAAMANPVKSLRTE